jgi:hypothetical protein
MRYEENLFLRRKILVNNYLRLIQPLFSLLLCTVHNFAEHEGAFKVYEVLQGALIVLFYHRLLFFSSKNFNSRYSISNNGTQAPAFFAAVKGLPNIDSTSMGRFTSKSIFMLVR